MTTIATDGVTISADGRTTAAERIVDDQTAKLHRMPDGSIVGQSGRCTHAHLALEELEAAIADGRDPRACRGDYQLLRLCPNGRVITYDSDLIALDTPVPAASGSGAAYALGAMFAGAGPREAVRIACRLDTGSGGKVRTLTPKELR